MFVGGSDERHFRVVELDKKKVEIGGVSIKPGASPGSAARKLLTSIAHQKGLKKNKKTTMSKVRFCIQEYTQGSSKKVYGPYVGHFHKYTAAELKKASTAGGKIKFTMKPVVKLSKKNNMSGGGVDFTKECKVISKPGGTQYNTICKKSKGIIITNINSSVKNKNEYKKLNFHNSIYEQMGRNFKKLFSKNRYIYAHKEASNDEIVNAFRNYISGYGYPIDIVKKLLQFNKNNTAPTIQGKPISQQHNYKDISNVNHTSVVNIPINNNGYYTNSSARTNIENNNNNEEEVIETRYRNLNLTGVNEKSAKHIQKLENMTKKLGTNNKTYTINNYKKAANSPMFFSNHGRCKGNEKCEIAKASAYKKLACKMQKSDEYKSENGVRVITNLKKKATKHGHEERRCPATGGKKTIKKKSTTKKPVKKTTTKKKSTTKKPVKKTVKKTKK